MNFFTGSLASEEPGPELAPELVHCGSNPQSKHSAIRSGLSLLEPS